MYTTVSCDNYDAIMINYRYWYGKSFKIIFGFSPLFSSLIFSGKCKC